VRPLSWRWRRRAAGGGRVPASWQLSESGVWPVAGDLAPWGVSSVPGRARLPMCLRRWYVLVGLHRGDGSGRLPRAGRGDGSRLASVACRPSSTAEPRQKPEKIAVPYCFSRAGEIESMDRDDAAANQESSPRPTQSFLPEDLRPSHAAAPCSGVRACGDPRGHLGGPGDDPKKAHAWTRAQSPGQGAPRWNDAGYGDSSRSVICSGLRVCGLRARWLGDPGRRPNRRRVGSVEGY